MKLLDQYDWIVLGDHPGALLSASLAARLGLSVLVLPMGSSSGLTLSKTGQILDPEPNFVMGLTGLERSQGLLQSCLLKAGMLPSEGELILKEPSATQVLTPSSRIRMGCEDQELKTELRREYGGKTADRIGLSSVLRKSELDVVSFWSSLPSRLTLVPDKKKNPAREPSDLKTLFKKIASARGLSKVEEKSWVLHRHAFERLRQLMGSQAEDFKNVLEGFWFSAVGHLPEDLGLSDFMHAMAVARTGAPFYGGTTAYRDLLARIAKRLGAHFPPKTGCKRIFIDNGKFVGVQMAQKGSMIGARGAILGCSLNQAHERVSVSGRNFLRRLKAAPKPRGWRFTLALSVHEEAIPPGMTRRAVWKESGAPVLEIEIAHPKEYGVKEPENRIIFLRTVLPYTQDSLSVEYQRLIAARMLRQLTEIIPFLEFHITRIYPDFRGIEIKDPNEPVFEASGSPDELSEMYGFAMPDLIPDNIRCYSGKGVGSHSGVEGLYVASDESFPKLGSLGATIAAVEAMASFAHRSGLAGPLV